MRVATNNAALRIVTLKTPSVVSCNANDVYIVGRWSRFLLYILGRSSNHDEQTLTSLSRFFYSFLGYTSIHSYRSAWILPYVMTDYNP